VRSTLSLVSLSALSHVSALGMAWTQGWHGHRDGMDTGMAWTQGWHGHRTRDTHDLYTRHHAYGLARTCAVGMQPAAACSLRRAPCASRSPSETASSPSKSPRCSSRSSGCRASIAAAAA
jgi:hypothetical protein